MARTIKIPCPEKPIVIESNSKIYTIHVVTPLFCGGVEARKNDPVTLIRSSSIRGQLRFWWRATRGAKFNDNKELKEAEGEIWGTTKNSSKISIAVDLLSKENTKIYDKVTHKNFPLYALFPFVPEKGEFTENIKFNLTVTWTSDKELNELEPALWAWVNFGGLGARTRRGCGSLFCQEFMPDMPDGNGLKAWYEKKLKEYDIQQASVRKWPILPDKDNLKIFPNSSNSVEAWNHVINLLRIFRQGENVGRDPGPGRSRWPEADSIRNITGMSSNNHNPRISEENNAFPRAEFGMPIVFQFKDYKKGDPDKPFPQLFPVKDKHDKQRMASPLILKPLCISETQAYPFIMPLKTEKFYEARVEHRTIKGSYPVTHKKIKHAKLTTYTNSPMNGRTTNGSAIEAFMNFVARERRYI